MKKFIKRSFEDKRVRFLFVGVLNTAFGYGLFALLVFLKVHYLLAQFLASILAIAHSYLWNKYFTFKSPERSLRELVRFISVYGVTYALNMLALYVLVGVLKFNPYIGGAITVFVATVISYFGHKNISFRDKKIRDAGRG